MLRRLSTRRVGPEDGFRRFFFLARTVYGAPNGSREHPVQCEGGAPPKQGPGADCGCLATLRRRLHLFRGERLRHACVAVWRRT